MSSKYTNTQKKLINLLCNLIFLGAVIFTFSPLFPPLFWTIKTNLFKPNIIKNLNGNTESQQLELNEKVKKFLPEGISQSEATILLNKNGFEKPRCFLHEGSTRCYTEFATAIIVCSKEYKIYYTLQEDNTIKDVEAAIGTACL